MDFAETGLPTGSCGNFEASSACYEPSGVAATVREQCLGKNKCAVRSRLSRACECVGNRSPEAHSLTRFGACQVEAIGAPRNLSSWNRSSVDDQNCMDHEYRLRKSTYTALQLSCGLPDAPAWDTIVARAAAGVALFCMLLVAFGLMCVPHPASVASRCMNPPMYLPAN